MWDKFKHREESSGDALVLLKKDCRKVKTIGEKTDPILLNFYFRSISLTSSHKVRRKTLTRLIVMCGIYLLDLSYWDMEKDFFPLADATWLVHPLY